MSEYENMQCAADLIAQAIHKAVREHVPSLRDYFAGHALTAFIIACGGPDCGKPIPRRAVNLAYEFADAMLAAREKKQ